MLQEGSLRTLGRGGNAAACRNKLSCKKQWGKFQMLKFYFNGSPNPTKVALFLEEAGIAY